VKNNGPDAAANVVLKDVLPASGASFVSASPASCAYSAAPPSVSCNLGSIASGDQQSVTITIKASGAGSLSDTASASSDTIDPANGNNASSATTLVKSKSADLAIAKAGPALVNAGDLVTYTLTASNNGPGDATGVVVTDSVPAGSTFVSASSDCSSSGGLVSCAIGNLAAGASKAEAIVVKAGSGNSLANVAAIKGNEPDPALGNNTSNEVDTRINHNPSCSRASAGPSLWPPNHRLVSLSISGVSDADGDVLGIAITGVRQDEPTNGLGDGDTAVDAKIGPGNAVQLRAERSGKGNGRVYHVYFTATDPYGGSCSGDAVVGVPHDQSPNGGAVDDGPSYDSTV
jgi:uncharacterized repeat protein (TIGR01451 family)